MRDENKIKIANSFPDEYKEFNINIEITEDEFKVLDEGIFALNMDDKWEAFVITPYLYFSRSWTEKCMFKVSFKKKEDTVLLFKVQVTSIDSPYDKTDINYDRTSFKETLQLFLLKIDLKKDERLSLPLIKETIAKYESLSSYKKAVDSTSVESCNNIYKSLMDLHSNRIEIIGLEEFKNNTLSYRPSDKLLSLHLSSLNNSKETVTFIYNHNATKMVGKIIVKRE